MSDNHPGVTEFRGQLAGGHISLGWVHFDSGRQSEAEREHRQALTIYQKLADDRTTGGEFAKKRGVHAQLPRLVPLRRAANRGRPRPSTVALAIFNEPAVDSPNVPDDRSDKAWSYLHFSNLLRRLGQFAEAQAYAERAVGIVEALVKEQRGYGYTIAEPYFQRGLARRTG